MTSAITPEFAAALLNAQGVALGDDGPAKVAKFAALALESSARAFADLAFEDEPAGYLAQLSGHAP